MTPIISSGDLDVRTLNCSSLMAGINPLSILGSIICAIQIVLLAPHTPPIEHPNNSFSTCLKSSNCFEQSEIWILNKLPNEESYRMSGGTRSVRHEKTTLTIRLINKPLGNISIFHLNSSLTAARYGVMFVDIEELETFEPPGQHRKTTKALHEDKTPGKTETYPHSDQCHPLCLLYRVNNEALVQYAACRNARC